MKQVKIFNSEVNFTLENNINTWLTNNNDKQILDIRISKVKLSGNTTETTVLILYE